MDPYLVPYLVKISENVDPISGEQCNNYTKSYDLFDTQAQKIIPCKYSNAEYVDYSFTDSISLRVESEIGKVTKYAIIKSADDIANASWYDQIIIITPNILVAKQNQFYGIIDDNNSILVPFLYEDVSAYKCEDSIYLITKKNGKYGIIDEYGNDILPFDYKCISCNSKLGIFVLQLDNITIILNPRTQEETILYIQATDVIDISEGIALLKNKQSRYLLYDLENDKLLTNYSYSSASPMINGFSHCCGYILVYKDGRTFEFDKDANLCRSKSILYKANHIGDDVWQIIV